MQPPFAGPFFGLPYRQDAGAKKTSPSVSMCPPGSLGGICGTLAEPLPKMVPQRQQCWNGRHDLDPQNQDYGTEYSVLCSALSSQQK